MFILKSLIFLASIFISFSYTYAINGTQKNFQGTPEQLIQLCSGKIDNDHLALLCDGFNPRAEFIKTGSQNTENSFEKIVQSISIEVEMSYDLFMIVNTGDPSRNKDLDRVVPAQKMLVIEKRDKNFPIFLREPKTGIITGLNFLNVKIAEEILDHSGSKLWDANVAFERDLNQYIRTREDSSTYSGLQYFNTTSGKATGRGYLPTASGVFPINTYRSEHRNTKVRRYSPEQPMSNALYFGYLYGNRPKPITELNRDYLLYPPSSGMAIHGTPSRFWRKLGKQRDSHGCVRSHPVVAEALFHYVMNMEDKEVPLLQWDLAEAATYELEDSSLLLHGTKPALIISFNGYESISI